MQVRGVDNLSPEERTALEEEGGRYVFFECCISLIFLTLRRPSPVYFLRPGELGLVRGFPYTVVSLLLGWWGVPWGLLYTPLVILTNLGGGRDVTDQVRPFLGRDGQPG